MRPAFVFPGQGSQVVGMGRDLYDHVQVARDLFDQADAVLGFSLSRLCFVGPEEELTATEIAQPALLTTSIALLRSLEALAGSHSPLRPLVVAGHSLGEYTALVAGGALDFPTALRLVRRRGTLMAMAHMGMMAAIVGVDQTALEAICREVSALVQLGEPASAGVVVANYNAPGQLVISGGVLAVERACAMAKARGAKRVLPLRVSAAFHSPLMAHAAEGMADAVAKVPIADMRTPLVANVTGSLLSSADDLRRELVSQVVSPVQWIASVHTMAGMGVDTFVEIGAGKVLTGLLKRIVPDIRLVSLGSLEDIRKFVAELS